MNTPLSDDGIPVEMLAAFIDGELFAADRLRVEQWLADHPEAAAELADQESLSPANGTFWQEVAAPVPASERWNSVLTGIERGIAGSSGSPPETLAWMGVGNRCCRDCRERFGDADSAQ